MLAAEGEEVWALPHFSGVDGVDANVVDALLGGGRGFEQRMQVCPVAQIGRAIQKDGAALVADAGAENQHPVISFAPETGIAEAGDGESRGRSCDHGFGNFLPGAKAMVFRDCEALHFTPGMDAIAQRGFGFGRGRSDTGINNGWLAVVKDGAAAENAVAVRGAGSGG